MITLAHLINPVEVPSGSWFHFVQQVAFATMQQARTRAGAQPVEWVSAQYAEDHPMIPPGCLVAPDLSRSILDLGSFSPPRKLPLLADILDGACQTTQADYLIYTNVDIALQPQFYTQVAAFIGQGYDAFTINRRTISAHYHSLAEIPAMQQEMGEPHRGWDCFVFPRAWAPRFALGEACIGAPFIGLLLLSNLVAFASNFREHKDQHLTFHLGNDRGWNTARNAPYARHNKAQTLAQLRDLQDAYGPFPAGSAPRTFLARHRTPFHTWLYEQQMRVYIPVKYTRSLRRIFRPPKGTGLA